MTKLSSPDQKASRVLRNIARIARIARRHATVASIALGLIGLGLGKAASAQEFAALASPPRFELSMEPGGTTRQILEITHMGSQTTPYRMYTADWVFLPDGSLTFYDALAVGSCRPWVALESRELSLAPNLKKRFRFEITVPKDAKPGECRFAVMIEGKDLKVNAGDAASFPAAARIGVIVYATVGKGAPVLEVMGAAVERIDGKLVPALEVRNTGNAHGRLGGILDAIDATGAKFELSPATLPILPGEMRRISLTAAPEDKAGEKPVFPVTVKGSLEWADKKTRVDQVFNAR